LLVWGIHGDVEYSDHPVEFFNSVGHDVELHALRWLPLRWDQPSRDQLTDKPELRIPEVKAALWIGLAQVEA
jgi:hypothetical protein